MSQISLQVGKSEPGNSRTSGKHIEGGFPLGRCWNINTPGVTSQMKVMNGVRLLERVKGEFW